MFHRICHVSTVADPGQYTPDAPSLPDTAAKYSPALPDPAKCPPFLPHHSKHSPVSERRTFKQQMLPVSVLTFNSSTATQHYNEDFPSDGRASEYPALLGSDPYYNNHFDDQETEFAYNVTESPGFGSTRSAACNAPISSPVLGLNDSLEDMECSDSKQYNTTHSKTNQDLEPWFPPPAEDHLFCTNQHDFFSTNHSFSRSVQSRHEEVGRSLHHSLTHPVRLDPSFPAPEDDRTYDPPIHSHLTGTCMLQNRTAHNPQTTMTSFSFNPSFATQNEDQSIVNPSFASRQDEGCLNSGVATQRCSPRWNPPLISSHSWGIGLRNTNPTTSVGSGNVVPPGLRQFDPDTVSNLAQPDLTSTHQPTASCRQHDSSSNSTSVLNPCHLIPRSTKAIASLVVRKPRRAIPPSEQKPVKALDLGIEGERERNVRLQSNDRVLAPTQLTHSSLLDESVYLDTGKTPEVANGEIVRSKYFPAYSSSVPSTSNRIISSSRVSSVRASGSSWGGASNTNLAGMSSTVASGSGWGEALGSSWGGGFGTNLAGMSSKIADLSHLKAFHRQKGSTGIFQQHNAHHKYVI